MKKIFFSLFAMLYCVCQTATAEEYTLSMLPHFSPDELTAMLSPLSKKLSEETGNDIKIALTENTAHYTAELLRSNIVIGYESPLAYVKVANVHEVIAKAVRGKNGDMLRGIIISRPETEISKVDDLKGKTIMIVSRNSAGGFLSQKLSLKENGIDVEWDCRLIEAADKREENVIISVSIGDVDAGFISESGLHKADQYIRPGSVISVTKTAPLPNWALSVSRNMPKGQKDDLREALLGLTEDTSELKALGITAFKAAEDDEYDIVRNISEL
ncbi:MAG: phosphate/phosphite/phosphonate ABC transporter substrate-binding protein [Candidatus Electrothrix sp. AR4]|nr:phosphate/phosphite/phosphonate ABC transporter substrate-binding protein [Candidatus Electrothrix sp. AR4]